MKIRLSILIPLLALAACATPESRVRGALMDAGLSQPVASCMAERMVDRLSNTQLRRLSSLAGMRKGRIDEMSVGDFAKRVRALDDPEIFLVVSTAGLGCAIAS